MKDFFKLWFVNLKMIFKSWAEYRIDFVIGITAMFIANIANVIYFWVIFQNIMSLNGWSFGQILFLSGLLSLVNGFWHTFLSGLSPWIMEDMVRNGYLDRVLLRPVGLLRQLLMSNIDEDGFGEIVAAIIITVTGARMCGFVWNFQNIILFSIFFISGVLIIFSIFLFFSSLAFWTTRIHSISEIVWRVMTFVKYPLEIYNPIIIFLLTFVVPLAFVNYYPISLFLGKGLYWQFAYLSPVIGILFIFLTYSFWKYSLKHYSSTGT